MAQYNIYDLETGLDERLAKPLRQLDIALVELGPSGRINRVKLAAAFHYLMLCESRRPGGPKFESSDKETLPLSVRDATLTGQHRQLLKPLSPVSPKLRKALFEAVTNGLLTENQLLWFAISGRFCDQEETLSGLRETLELPKALVMVNRMHDTIGLKYIDQVPLPEPALPKAF